MHTPIRWFANNPVAANLLMVLLILAGLFGAITTKQEEFPNIDIKAISIMVPYLGAAPVEVEKSVCVRIEEAIQSVEGIDKLRSTATEGSCQVFVELEMDADEVVALNAAIREGHYAAYYWAAEFTFAWHHPDALAENRLTEFSWRYLGCVQHPECDQEGFRRAELSEQLLPAEVQQVIDFAEEFDPAAETFGFERLSLPLHTHSAPLIYPE